MGAEKQIMPSYTKLMFTLVVIAVGAYYPVKVLSVQLGVQVQPTDSEKSSADPEPAVEPRLFDEYPHAAADQDAHPSETRAALWISFRQLTGPERIAALAPWRAAPRMTPVADGLYRLECSGPTAAAITRLLKSYPYAIAPGEHTDAAFTEAYRRVAGCSPFRVCVVRGDWLASALASESASADRLGVETSASAAERYLTATVSTKTVLKPFPPVTRDRVTAPSTVTRRALEAADGSGHSLFVRWATATGAGVPVY